MEEAHLYHQIAESIRRQILDGKLKAGDRLPGVRQIALEWNCTPGTAQRAYQQLARDGLVTSRAGQGVRVAKEINHKAPAPLRKATLINRAEAFLLEMLSSGYGLEEIQQGIQLASDRWRTVALDGPEPLHSLKSLRFCGSHDLAVGWLVSHFSEIAPGYTLNAVFNGSLGGLVSLLEGRCELAGCHLWDADSDSYNSVYVERLLPNQSISLITLAHRRLGLILAAGNPLGITAIPDIARREVRFINRQPGAGTRVWLEANLQREGILPGDINGYDQVRLTHLEVARAIAEGQADVGLGLETAAFSFGLDFIFLTRERYELAVQTEQLEHPAINALLSWLKSTRQSAAFPELAGYDFGESGLVRQV